MESTKIVKSLRKLDPEIRKRFRIYLLSPYFNRSKTRIRCYDAIAKFIDNSPDKKLTKEGYWKKVFGKEKLNEINLRKLNSDLLRVFKAFLAQEQYEQDKGRKMNYLMRAVHEWGLDSLQTIAIRQSDKFYEDIPFRNANYYLQKYTTEKEYYQLIDFDKNREARSNVEEILKNLDLFYLSEKLYFYANSIVRKKFLAHDYKFFLIDEIMNHIEEVNYESTPAVAVFYFLSKALSGLEDEDAFSQLKTLVDSSLHLFPRDEANEIYTNLLNYVVGKTNSGELSYNTDYFVLFQKMEEKGFLLEDDGSITSGKFRNATTAALRIEEYQWAEDFVLKYGEYLPKEVRANTKGYALALIHFRKEEYAKVIPILTILEYDDVAVGLAAKILLAHSYYELEEFDVLESHILAFSVLLSRRKDITTIRRENYLKHLRYISRLIRIVPGDSFAVNTFIQDLKADGKIINTNLLLEKAERLK